MRWPSVLFLDVDGVLNTPDDICCWGSDAVNSKLVDNLIWIMKETGCRVVISSSWRFSGLENVTRMIVSSVAHQYDKAFLADISSRFIDVTGEMDSRKMEILHWVKQNKPKAWVAVDDMPLGIGSDNFVKTDEDTGLDSSRARRVIRLLNKEAA